ncbi:family 31 glycoside hydrolase [Melampsora americana]|nr:family 31 glycoside hydrolase [Melampsora americana]
MITLSKHSAPLIVIYLCSIILPALSVRRGDFKTCDQASFCRRNRARATRAQSAEFSPTWRSPYKVSEPPVWIAEERTLRARLTNELYPQISFALNASFVSDSEGTMRIKIDEVGGLRQRYNEADRWTLLRQPSLSSQDELQIKIGNEETVVDWGRSSEHGHLYRFSLSYHPLLITLHKDDVPHIVLNERGLFNMEHFRQKSSGQDPASLQDGLNIHESSDGKVAPPKDLIHPGFKDVDEEGMWDETFGGRTDSKPKGPESLSLDITFPGYQHVYGIPEHASPLSLKTTRGTDSANKEAYTDPYRLWNLDVFEYEADSEMALYGAIPFMKAHRAGSTVGVFWLNAAETWIDVEKHATKTEIMKTWKQSKAQKTAREDQGPNSITTTTHWMSETGILDLFLFLGPSSKDIFSSFGALVGTTLMPPYFSIAHHQCRWNYVSQEDLLDVISNFDRHDIPVDVIWLDIEYAEEHKYFVWDKKAFPDPLKMIATLEATGRKVRLVTIVDPHLKRSSNYYVYKEAVELDVLVKLPDGSEYEGWCWTGSSSWTDYFNPKTWDWWAGLFKFNKYRESTVNVHNWLDMNEPSVFNAPEITLPRDNIHFGGWEHRDVHNLNGMLTHNQSNRGLQERTSPPMRGFVLSRSYFAGSQRYGAIWQGDNMGTWDHLKVSVPMLLSNAIAGMAFNGADVGGFFGNPSNEMLVRWYQAGAFFPFFRAHAHIDTKRREPYLFDEPFRGHMVDMIKLRYTLLPVWYTSFFENTFTGVPMTVPQYVMFPNDEGGFAIDDQFYLGSSGLLVKPITTEGQTETQVYLADAQPYYNYFTYDLFLSSASSNKRIQFPAPLNTLPLFLRGGHIVTRRDLIRRAAPMMRKDPITLIVALDKDGGARGTLYLDDGESLDHERGQFVYRSFEVQKVDSKTFKLFSGDAVGPAARDAHPGLASALAAFSPNNAWSKKTSDIHIQKVIILGLPEKPTCVKASGAAEGLLFEYAAGLTSSIKSAKGTGLGKRTSVLTIFNAAVPVNADWSIVVKSQGTEACETSKSVPSVDPMVSLQSSECPKGYFQCRNQGHIPACVRISRVNDGICEPECCDGSDEAGNSDVQCPNRCAAVSSEYTKKLDSLVRKFKAGNGERKNYILFGQREKIRLQELVKSLDVELISLKAKEQDAKAEKERVERVSETEVNKLKASELYRKMIEYQNAIKGLKEHNEKLKKDLDQLDHILSDLKVSLAEYPSDIHHGNKFFLLARL